jgi:hypothetical protein
MRLKDVDLIELCKEKGKDAHSFEQVYERPGSMKIVNS